MGGKKRIGIVYAPTVQAHLYADKLMASVAFKGSVWKHPAADLASLPEGIAHTDMVITVGGDGTILRVAAITAPYQVPILGINLGRLGFMTELRAEEALDKIAWYLDDDMAWMEDRSMLQAVLSDHEDEGKRTFHALNDVVLGRGPVPRLVHIDAQVNGVPLTTYYADALIVATATGSTGYALAAGGPILYAGSRDLVVMGVAPHVSLSTPLVLPPDTVMTLSVKTEAPATMSVDGLWDADISVGDVLEIQRSPYCARFLRARDPRYFYATLIERLGLIPGARGSPSEMLRDS